MTVVFFTTDVHGSERCFRKFVNAAAFYNADVLILGGDVTGKMVIPVVEEGSNRWTAEFAGGLQVLHNVQERDEMVKTIRFSGYYPYLSSPSEVDELNEDPKKVDVLFTRLMGETMERWAALAEERLKPQGTKIFITPGNDDRFVIDEALSKSSFVQNPEGQVVRLDDDHEMISTGWTNHTPWDSPRETTEEELAKKIDAMTGKVQDMANCVFNTHCPPINTPLDAAPKITKDLRTRTAGGQTEMIAAGSVAVRDAITKYQPLLGLHGHIHESKGACNIGRTLCLNPGSEYGEGIVRGVLVTLTKKGYKHYVFTNG